MKESKLVNMTLAEINKAEWNPRLISRERRDKLKASMEEFGFLQPLVVNKTTDTLLSGHQRLAVLREAGHGSVPVYMVEVPKEIERGAAVALNNHAGSYDEEKLEKIISGIDAKLAKATMLTDEKLSKFGAKLEEKLSASRTVSATRGKAEAKDKTPEKTELAKEAEAAQAPVNVQSISYPFTFDSATQRAEFQEVLNFIATQYSDVNNIGDRFLALANTSGFE